MRHIKIEWKHDYPDDPILLYSEIDDDSWEVRKVEVFRDGQMGYADREVSTESTGLGDVPVPSVESIASDPQFVPSLITEEEFDRIWQQAISA
jgi:hypothetical protein